MQYSACRPSWPSSVSCTLQEETSRAAAAAAEAAKCGAAQLKAQQTLAAGRAAEDLQQQSIVGTIAARRNAATKIAELSEKAQPPHTHSAWGHSPQRLGSSEARMGTAVHAARLASGAACMQCSANQARLLC